MPKPPRLTPRANAFGGGLARSKRAVYSACFGLKNAVTRPVLGVKTGSKMRAGRGVIKFLRRALLPFPDAVWRRCFRRPYPPSGSRFARTFFGRLTPLPAHVFVERKSPSIKCARKGGNDVVKTAPNPPSGAWFRKVKMEGGKARKGFLRSRLGCTRR